MVIKLGGQLFCTEKLFVHQFSYIFSRKIARRYFYAILQLKIHENRGTISVYFQPQNCTNILLCNLAAENVREQRYKHFSVKMISWVKLAPPLSTTQKKATLPKAIRSINGCSLFSRLHLHQTITHNVLDEFYVIGCP